MHFVTSVSYESDYKLRLSFDDGSVKTVDLAGHLTGEIFLPLKDLTLFRSAHLDPDLDTVVWDNGADMSPDFLYLIGKTADRSSALKVAEPPAPYG